MAGSQSAAEQQVSADRLKQRSMAYQKSLPEPHRAQVVDFFSGCGGMSLGFADTRQSGLAFNVLAGIDIDALALQTYQANLGSLAVEHDVRTLAEQPRLLAELIPGFDPNAGPTVFLGCPPCQGFSAHRKKDPRDDPRNNLVLLFAKIVSFWRPDVVVMENVPEMLKGRFEHYYESARDELLGSGYALAEGILDLSQFGVPQRRRRSIVIASRIGAPHLPTSSLSKGEERTVRDAIAHLDPIEAGEEHEFDPWHRAPAHTPRILDMIRSIPANGGDRRDLSNEQMLACHQALDSGSTPGFTDVYGRLRWDEPAVTITAKSSTPSCGRFLHPEQHRNISVREAALLQGFPHDFAFMGPFTNQYRQVGEAVPPAFARHLANCVLDLFRPKPTVSKQASAMISAVGSASLDPQDEDSEYRSVDLFAGAGGLSLGLRAAGIGHGLAVDLDESATMTFAKNLSGDVLCRSITDPIVRSEIAEFDASRLILAGGPPCQGFSQQRRGKDKDARNDLVLEFGRLAAGLPSLPAAVVLENVMYLDSPRGRKIYGSFVRTLEQAGYVLHRHDLNSAEYGVAQLRRRIIVVALMPEAAARYRGPQPLSAERFATIGDALLGLTTKASDEVSNHRPSNEQAKNIRRMAYVDMGRGRMAIPDEMQLDCHRGYDGHLDVYGRLDWFGQARTITGGFDSASRGEYVHPFRNRSITAREAARIQGFPDWFAFEGNRAAVRKQIGNAVPPPVGYAVGLALREALEAN